MMYAFSLTSMGLVVTRQKITKQYAPDYRNHSTLIWETSINGVKRECYLKAQL